MSKRVMWVVMVMAGLAVAACGDDSDGDGSSGSCVDNATSMGLPAACAECNCNSCGMQLDNCQDSACQSVLTCGALMGCRGTQCYCGTASTTQCLSAPNGPCKNELVQASGLLGSTNCMTVDSCAVGLVQATAQDPQNPVSRANALSSCSTGTPAVTNPLDGTVVMPAQPGACNAQCGG